MYVLSSSGSRGKRSTPARYPRMTMGAMAGAAAMVRRTKEEALATRHSILDAAELLFEKRGVSRTSLQDIAEAAGVTRGAIYWHFQGKEDLFTAMMERAT